MATKVSDTFTGTNGTDLASHTPDTGGAWSKQSGVTGGLQIVGATGRLRVSTTSTAAAYVDATVGGTADGTVSVDLVPVASRVGNNYPWVSIRSDGAGNEYRAQFNWTSAVPGLYLYKVVGGTSTQLGTIYTGFTPVVGTPFSLYVKATGTAIVAGINGTDQVTATDSTYTAAGKAGVGHYADNASDVGDSAGIQFDNLLFVDTGSAGPTSYTLTAPSPATGRPSVASSNFTLTLNSAATSTVTFTLSDGSAGGTFTPSSPQITSGNSSVTFTYTAASTGAKTISVTDDAGLTDPSSVTFTAYSLSLSPGSQTVGVSTAATLTATLTGGSGTLTASKDNGTLSTTTPTSGVGFTLTDTVARTDTVTVTGPGGTSQNATVTFTSSPAVSPSSATIDQGATQSLTASNFTGGSVTWSSNNTAAATVNASTGVVTGVAHGLGTSQTATITATGVSNPAQTATATITVRAVAITSVSPSSATVGIGLTQQFAATVSGTTNTTVNWSVPTGSGSVDSSGLYTAPGSAGSATVRATAAAQTSLHSDASVTITAAYTAQTSAGVFTSGLSTVGFAVYARSGSTWSVYQARTTTGVAEIGSGTGSYGATFSAAYDTEYQVVWDDGGSPATYAGPDRVYRASAATGSAPTAAEVADAIWDELRSGHVISGSFGEALDAKVSTRLATSSYVAPLDAAGTRTAVGLASANLDTQLSAISTKTTNLPASPAAVGSAMTLTTAYDPAKTAAQASQIPANFTSGLFASAGVFSVGALVNSPVGSGGGLDAAGTRAALGLASANLDTQLAAIPTTKTGYKLASDGMDAITVETGVNGRQAISAILAASCGVLSGAAGTSITIKGGNVTTTRIVAAVDSSGNRTGVTLTLPT